MRTATTEGVASTPAPQAAATAGHASMPPRTACDAAQLRVPTARAAQATASSRDDRTAAERRLLAGTPLQAARVIPSDAAMPLDAQRVFRGWIVIAIVVMILLGIGLTLALIARVANRTVYYAPTAERIGAIATREPTDYEARATALMLVQRMESYTPETAKSIWSSLLPYLHPSLHQKLKSDYEVVAEKAEKLWQHRVAMLLAAAIGKRSAGIISMAVFYDSAELTGKGDERTLARIVPKAAYLEFAMDTPSQDNPLGLIITRYQTYEKKDWVAHGFPDMWDDFRAKDRR